MSIIEGKIRQLDGGHIAFMCPGCDALHVVRTQDATGVGPQWRWNGSFTAPTLEPSVRTTTGHYVTREKQSGWCDQSGGTEPCDCTCCHSFVRDGRIQFLNDCTHQYAGQTLPLPDIEDNTHALAQ